MIRTPRCLSKTARARGKSLTRSAASRKPVPRADVTLARVIPTDLECYHQRPTYSAENYSRPNARPRIEPPAVQLHQGISFQFDDILNETSRGFFSAIPQVLFIQIQTILSRHSFYAHPCWFSDIFSTRMPLNVIENNRSFSSAETRPYLFCPYHQLLLFPRVA